MEQYKAWIIQTAPLPFVKRFRVYSVDLQGKGHYIATFRYQRDAENYVNWKDFGVFKRSKSELQTMREWLLKELGVIKKAPVKKFD